MAHDFSEGGSAGSRSRGAVRSGAALLLACASSIAAVGPALAHDMWIVPSAFHVAPGEAVRLGLELGYPGESQPVARDSRRIVRFEMVDAFGSGTDIPGLDGSKTTGLVRPLAPGSYVLVYQGDDAFADLDAPRFESYLAEEGLGQAIDERERRGESDKPGRERYTRSLKALLTVGGPHGAPLDRQVGLPFELVIEPHGSSSASGSSLTARVLDSGQPLADILVEAIDLDTGDLAGSTRSDASGRVTFDLPAGRFMLAAVRMVRDDGKRADWRSIWTSTTFELAYQTTSAPY